MGAGRLRKKLEKKVKGFKRKFKDIAKPSGFDPTADLTAKEKQIIDERKKKRAKQNGR